MKSSVYRVVVMTIFGFSVWAVPVGITGMRLEPFWSSGWWFGLFSVLLGGWNVVAYYVRAWLGVLFRDGDGDPMHSAVESEKCGTL